MTVLRQTTTALESKHTDQNGRIRSNVTNLIYEARYNYGDNLVEFSNTLTTGGTATFDVNQQGMTLGVTTTSGSKVLRSSTRYLSKLCGRTTSFQSVIRLGPAKTNLTSRFGLYDAEDGVFIERTISGVSLCLRSKVSGSVVDTYVTQANWNRDPLNGNGSSGVTLNADNMQNIVIRFGNTGIGSVTVGFLLNNTLVVAHVFGAPNTTTVPTLRPISLPIQCEIFNTATAASSSTMFVGACAMFADGPYDPQSKDIRTYYIDTGTTAVPVVSNAWTPVTSVRLAATKNGIKYRGGFIIDSLDIIVNSTAIIMWQAVLNGTLVGAGSWTTPTSAPTSALQRENAATGISGGTTIMAGYAGGGSTSKIGLGSIEGSGNWVLSGRPIGANDVLTFSCRALGSNTSVFVIMNYKESED